jgi:hypothetical protein
MSEYFRYIWNEPLIAFCGVMMGVFLKILVTYGTQTRAWQHWRAVSRGYFWLPCPACGEMWGGQEGWTHSLQYGPKSKEALTTSGVPGPGKGAGVCTSPECHAFARWQNAAVSEAWNNYLYPPPPKPQFEGPPRRRLMVKNG